MRFISNYIRLIFLCLSLFSVTFSFHRHSNHSDSKEVTPSFAARSISSSQRPKCCPNIPYQTCLMPNRKRGHCRHLHHCIQNEFKNDYLRFMDYLCVIQRSSVGVCCPDDKFSGYPEGIAGDLPATAYKDEDSAISFKISKAEQRGCGLSTRAEGRVTGTRAGKPRDWPWMALVTPKNREQYCGGTLISDRHVLTAAHCTNGQKAEDLSVRLGEYDLTRSNDSRSYNFRVIEIRRHEKYDSKTYYNDVAILKLHRPAVFNTYVWPICLPPPGMQMTNETAIVIGWGVQFIGGPKSNVLMEVSVPIWDHQKCKDAYVERVSAVNICAAGYEGEKDACQHDSGGPLMYQMPSGRWAIIGIVSWGLRCGEANHPGIYTKVESYLEWIVQNARF
ncbi:hypothetical protein K1T71_012156 [Dendrolimus kikuchii]|uniref:Uncharacterized protein n=1 Tax=Dendrolimus kikuchii TaxID=765133 RepID=A0ACC1CKW1_9NEOP|nr:hypothetical protein K1T71_012156 [Dendrolimus kikuchii]